MGNKPREPRRSEKLKFGETGQHYEANVGSGKELPPKKYRQHRWVAQALWHVTNQSVREAQTPEARNFLDHENLMDLFIFCWDCELLLGEIEPGSACEAEPAGQPGEPGGGA